MKLKVIFFSAALFVPFAYANEPFDVDSLDAIADLRTAPVAPTKIEWKAGHISLLRFESPRAFADDRLWGLLDWTGGGPGWYEVDTSGIVSAQLKPLIQGASQAWVRQGPNTKTLVATLKGKASAPLEMKALASPISEAKQPLEARFHGNLSIFDDFSLEKGDACSLDAKEPCRYTHREDSRLRLEVSRKRISMILRTPDAQGLPIVEHFRKLDEAEQREEVNDFRAYFSHEFSLMVRSFLETTPGLFNWQLWHWYTWGADGLISKEAIRAMLETEQKVGSIDVFKMTCKDGRHLRFWSDGQGTLGMILE